MTSKFIINVSHRSINSSDLGVKLAERGELGVTRVVVPVVTRGDFPSAEKTTQSTLHRHSTFPRAEPTGIAGEMVSCEEKKCHEKEMED